MRSGKHRGQKKQKRKGAYDKSGGITHDTAAFAFRTKDILKIRSRPRLEPGSDYHYLVRIRGLEQHGPTAGGATKAPVGLLLVRGSQPVGMSTGRTAAKIENPNLFSIGEGFGFFVF